jgi:hypothetical protein
MTDISIARRLGWIAPLLLLIVAAFQICLVRTANLTPWKGGGFGMFSTNDGNANRSLRILVTGPQRSEYLILKGNLEDLGARAQMFPGSIQLEKLAKAIIKDQQLKNLPIDTVHIEVWGIDFRKSDLYPTSRLIRSYEYSEKR